MIKMVKINFFIYRHFIHDFEILYVYIYSSIYLYATLLRTNLLLIYLYIQNRVKLIKGYQKCFEIIVIILARRSFNMFKVRKSRNSKYKIRDLNSLINMFMLAILQYIFFVFQFFFVFLLLYRRMHFRSYTFRMPRSFLNSLCE